VTVTSDLRVQIQHSRAVNHSVALGLLSMAIVLLWAIPMVGVVAAVAVGFTLAPWGRRLGERLLIGAVVTAGSVALIFAALQVASASLPTLTWRMLVTAALLGEIAAVVLRRSAQSRVTAPVWPVAGWSEGIALGTGVVLFAAMGLPYLLVSNAHALTALLGGWDHSSHLTMFVQTMHAQGWNMSVLGDGVMFGIYPMLHTGLWSVGEWVAGVQAQTPGAELIGPYLAWTSLTAAASAVLLMLTASVAARAFVARGSVSAARERIVPVLATAFTAVWCLLGTFALMADYAFTNFLLGATLAGAAVVVATRSRQAMRTLGWFVLPLGAVAATYAYPPLAGGVAIAATITFIVLVRDRSRAVVWMLAVTAACGIAALPALHIIIEPFKGQSVGEIKGGIPAFELWPAIVLAVVVTVVLSVVLRRVPIACRLSMLGPLVATGAVAALFAVQAVVSGLAISDSYYTKKVIYALMLLVIPLAMALAAVLASRWIPAVRGARRVVAAAVAVVVVAVAVSVTSAVFAGARPDSDGVVAAATPVGVWSMAQRVDRVTYGDTEGRAELLASSMVKPGWVTVVVGGRGEVESGRTVAGLSSVLTWSDNSVIQAAHDDVRELARMMRNDPSLKVQFVATEVPAASQVTPLLAEFGSARVTIEVLQR